MGQYYHILLKEAGKKTAQWRCYDRSVDGEYMMAKLMEHSWWYNPTLRCVCGMIYHNPTHVLWVGDYSNDGYPVNGLEENEMNAHWRKAWLEKKKGGLKQRGLDGSKQIDIDNKFIVNHTTYEYIDCAKYMKEAGKDGWIVHPLSLLTAIGNGLGGGDYYGINKECVGMWACDIISVEDTPPEDYIECDVIFYE